MAENVLSFLTCARTLSFFELRKKEKFPSSAFVQEFFTEEVCSPRAVVQREGGWGGAGGQHVQQQEINRERVAQVPTLNTKRGVGGKDMTHKSSRLRGPKVLTSAFTQERRGVGGQKKVERQRGNREQS